MVHKESERKAHHVTCPSTIRTENHRKRLKKWWSSKEWKEYVRTHTLNQTCKACGCASGQVKGDRKPAVLTINHLYRDLYNSFEEYLQFNEGRTEVTCTTCNWMFEKGMNICPVCYSDTVAKYKMWYQPMCSSCFHMANPEIKEQRKKKAEEIKAIQKKLRQKNREEAKEWLKRHKDGWV